LSLPNGSTVEQTPTEELRRVLAPFVEGAHTVHRLQLVDDYAAALKRVHDVGGVKAVEAWWKNPGVCRNMLPGLSLTALGR
jgi:hypothetical protein